MALRGGGGGGRGKAKNRQSPYSRGGGGWEGPRAQQEGQERGFVLPNPTEWAEPPSGATPTAGELPPLPAVKKFSNKARLFFGNLPRDFAEEELRKMLVAHGEVHEIYHNKEKNFGFARMVGGLYLESPVCDICVCV